LTDENGNNFKTSNSEVFTKVVEAINSTLISKINEIEQQISKAFHEHRLNNLYGE